MTIIRVISPNIVEPYFLARFLNKRWFEGYYLGVCRRHVNQASISLERLKQVLVPLPPLHEQRKIAHVLSSIQRAIELQDRVIAAARELKRSLMRHLFTYGQVPVNQIDRVPLKETEIGPVPEHWEVGRLEDIVLKVKQIDPGKKPGWYFKYIDVSCVSSSNLRICDYLLYRGENAPSRARKLIKKGDVLFATVRPYLKRIAQVTSDLDGHICSTAFCVIRANIKIANSDFLYFITSTDSFVERVTAHQRGSSYPAVTDKDVLRELIPTPPLSEQQQIANILKLVNRKIYTEQTRKSALQSLFQTMLHLLMTGKVRVKDLEVNVDAFGR